jgi:hypothetical protein
VRRTPRRSEYDACRSDSTEDLLFFLDYAARDEAFCAITSRAFEVLEWVWSRSGDDVLTVLPGFLLCPDWVFCMKGLVSEWADTASEGHTVRIPGSTLELFVDISALSNANTVVHSFQISGNVEKRQ